MGQGDQAGRDQGERVARSTGQGDPKQAAAPKDIPTLVVFGDNIALDSRWPQIRKNSVDFVGEIPLLGSSGSGFPECSPAARRKIALDPPPHGPRKRSLQPGSRQTLQQSLLVRHPVPGKLARELEVLFPARHVFRQREVVHLQA